MGSCCYTMRDKMTPLCRLNFQIHFIVWNSAKILPNKSYPIDARLNDATLQTTFWNYFNEWKLVILIKRFCSTATHDLGYHMSKAVVTQTGQLRPIWLTLANLTGKLQTFFLWKCLNSDWYYIEICFKGVIYNKSALVQLITWCRASDRPLSESMLTQPLTHIYAALWGSVLKENRVS